MVSNDGGHRGERMRNWSDRFDALKRLILVLPEAVRPCLQELFHASENDPSREFELFSSLRSILNSLAQEGALSRRDFLQIASLVFCGGLAPFLYPEKAHAWQAWTGFWQNINNNPYMLTNSGTDPYWDYVVLLMNMDGSNGSTVFVDESNVGKTPTINGAPYLDYTASTSSPYSGKVGSAKFNGSTNYVSFASSFAFNFGSSDFTIELWFKLSALPASSIYWPLVAQRASSQHAFDVGIYNSSGTYYITAEVSSSGSAITNSASPTVSLSTGTWYHVAFVRQGTTLRTFINGTQQASTTFSSSVFSSSAALTVGYDTAASTYLNGSIADLRIYNGVAKYTAAFTAPAAPIGLGSFSDPYWGYCVLACPFENSVKDCSGKRFSVTGSPALNTATKKYGSAALSLNGSSFVSTPDSSDWTLGKADFTVETYVQMSSLPANTGNSASYYMIVGQWSSGSCSWALYLRNNGGTYQLSLWTSTDGSSATESLAKNWTGVSANTWYHIALTRQSGLLNIFVDGVSLGTASYASALYDSSAALSIGAQADSNSYFSGYIDSLRITKGYARYASNFTPPTVAFPVGRDETVDPFWTNTVFAMHMDDLNEATGRHSMTNNGSLTADGTTKKLGSASASFDGTSQYLTTPNSADYDFSNGDFTIELWMKTSQTSITALTSRWPSSIDNGAWILHLNVTSNKVSFHAYGSGSVFAILTSVTSVNDGVWHHIAVTRLNGTSAMYIDGIQQATSTTSYSVSGSGDVWIGNQESDSDRYFSGNIDDLRITKGVARYVQNFTPPTRAFATIPVSTYVDFDPFFSNVVLLMRMDGTNGSTTFTDSSSSAKTFINNGGVALSTSVSKFGNASGAFNGSTQFLEVASSSDFAFGTGVFTVEFWMYPTVVDSTYRRIIGSTIGDWSGTMFNIRLNDGNTLELTASDSAFAGSKVISANTWYHVVGVFNGSEMSLYVNGALEDSIETSGVNVTDTTCYIGGHGTSDDEYFAGYLDDIRITKGVARYSYPSVTPTDFAPPRTSLPTSAGIVTSGLVALLDAGDAASYDGTSQTWKNIVISPADSSGQTSYDFMHGSSTSSESSDPTFVGISGGRSANDYFSLDGGDYFTLSGSNTTFLNSLHKVGAAFTIVMVDQGVGSSDCYFGTAPNSASSQGICYTAESNQRLWVSNGSSLVVNTNCSGSWTRLPGWNFHAVAVNAGAGTALFYLNGSSLSKSISYSGASSGSSLAAKVASAGNGGNQCFSSGARIGSLVIYNRALSKTELDQNFAAIRSRFGI